jgi:acyl carrier protein
MAAYVAANRYLDGLVALRRRNGLPGASIQWGMLESGLGSESLRTALGSRLITAAEVRELIPRLMSADCDQSMVVRTDWMRYLEYGGAPRVLDEVRVGPARPTPAATVTVDLSFNELVVILQQETADVLGLPDDELPDPDVGFFDLGMNSLLAIHLKESLESRFGIDVAPSAVAEFPTIEAMARNLHETYVAGSRSNVDSTIVEPSGPPAGSVAEELARLESVLGIG